MGGRHVRRAGSPGRPGLLLVLLTLFGVLAMHGPSAAAPPGSMTAAHPRLVDLHHGSPAGHTSLPAQSESAPPVHPHVLTPCVADAARGTLLLPAAPPGVFTLPVAKAPVLTPRLSAGGRLLPPPDLTELCISRT